MTSNSLSPVLICHLLQCLCTEATLFLLHDLGQPLRHTRKQVITHSTEHLLSAFCILAWYTHMQERQSLEWGKKALHINKQSKIILGKDNAIKEMMFVLLWSYFD